MLSDDGPRSIFQYDLEDASEDGVVNKIFLILFVGWGKMSTFAAKFEVFLLF